MILGGKKPTGKPRDRWEDKTQKEGAKLLNTENLSISAKHRSDWKKKMEEAMFRKWAEHP